MTDPVAPIAALPATPLHQPREPAAAVPAAQAPTPAPAQPAPISVDVSRSDNGVFIYTLRDPATDTVLAVIPREAVRPRRDGRNVDERV